jgi:hypothetical protein
MLEFRYLRHHTEHQPPGGRLQIDPQSGDDDVHAPGVELFRGLERVQGGTTQASTFHTTSRSPSPSFASSLAYSGRSVPALPLPFSFTICRNGTPASVSAVICRPSA